MKISGIEISDLTDAQLLANYGNCLKLEITRSRVSRHEKFKKLEFPPINPIQIQLKNELHREITNRKLDINNAYFT